MHTNTGLEEPSAASIFTINADEVYQELGYSRKDNLHRKLRTNFKAGLDYYQQPLKGNRWQMMITQEVYDYLLGLHLTNVNKQLSKVVVINSIPLEKVIKELPGDEAILHKFIELTTTYEVRYAQVNDAPLFVMSQLCKSKGMHSEDFTKNYLNLLPLSSSVGSSTYEFKLGGTFTLLKGKELVEFKRAWLEQSNPSLGKVASLWVGDWVGAYSYLTEGSSPASKEFKELGADSIDKSAKKALKELEEVNQEVEELLPLLEEPPLYTSSYTKPVKPVITEKRIQEELILLATRINTRFRREFILKDTLTNKHTRRFDLVEELPDRFNIIELKLEQINLNIINEIIANRAYLDLAEGHHYFQAKPVHLTFCSPKGIDDLAQRLLKRMECLHFLHLHDLAQSLLLEAAGLIREESPSQVRWYMDTYYLPECRAIFPYDLATVLAEKDSLKLMSLEECVA